MDMDSKPWARWVLDVSAWIDASLRAMLIVGIFASWILFEVKFMGNDIQLGNASEFTGRKK